jgi:hypothetical protein
VAKVMAEKYQRFGLWFSIRNQLQGCSWEFSKNSQKIDLIAEK